MSTDPKLIEAVANIVSTVMARDNHALAVQAAQRIITAYEAARGDGVVARRASSLEVDNAKMRYILGRYVREVPLGYQPHMLAHLAEEALKAGPHQWTAP